MVQQARIRPWLIAPCQVTLVNLALQSQERMQTMFSFRPGGRLLARSTQACLATASLLAELPANQHCIMPGQISVDRLESSSPSSAFKSLL